MPDWIELSVRAHVEAVDAIAEVFRVHGTSAVAVEHDIAAGPEGELGSPADTARVVAYLPESPAVEPRARSIEEALWHLAAFDLAPISDLSRRVLSEEDWANAWKEHFHPFRIGKRLVIKPSWQALEPDHGDVTIELDPGMAFGTGLHPTTRLCLEALERIMRPGMDVLDVGTGSGILAIAAAKLGAGHVLAVDTSEVAVQVAQENMARNGVEGRVRVDAGSIQPASARFDVIVANIIASVIAEIAAACTRALQRGGVLIASGIIADRAPLVRAAFDDAGLVIERTAADGDWQCFEARLRAGQ